MDGRSLTDFDLPVLSCRVRAGTRTMSDKGPCKDTDGFQWIATHKAAAAQWRRTQYMSREEIRPGNLILDGQLDELRALDHTERDA